MPCHRLLGLDTRDSYLDAVLADLRKRELVHSHRGTRGGWLLARSPEDITVADVIRALDGPITSVRGVPPRDLHDTDVDDAVVELWCSLEKAVSDVLEHVTIADLAPVRNEHARAS